MRELDRASPLAFRHARGIACRLNLTRSSDVEQALAPSDPVQRYGWLFARQLPDLGTGSRFSDPAYDAALREQRTAAIAEVEKRGLDAVRELAGARRRREDRRRVPGRGDGGQAPRRGPCHGPADSPAERLAEGWLARRFQQDGWTWLDRLLAGEPAPEQAALALLMSRDYPKAWQVADTRGTPVAEAFWRYFPINGLGHGFGHAAEAAGRLAQAGRAAAALKLVVIYLDRSRRQPADFLIGLLGQFAGAYQSDPEIGLLTEYDFRTVFEYLNQHADPGAQRPGRAAGVGVHRRPGDEPPVDRAVRGAHLRIRTCS